MNRPTVYRRVADTVRRLSSAVADAANDTGSDYQLPELRGYPISRRPQ